MRIPAGEKVVALLGYILFGGIIIARWVKRDSMFVQFHARQGLVLFLLLAAVWLVVGIALIPASSSGMATMVLFGVLFLATLLYFWFTLAGIVKVLLGERYRMPVVADVAILMRL